MPGENLNILLADDIKTMRTLIKGILRKIGCTNIFDAADGLEAMSILKQESIDLVICDWNMPKMDGLEVLKAMRGDAQFKSIPFLMVTAEDSKARVTEAIQAGTTDYLVKPFNEETLRKKLQSVLDKC